jgi:mono/diheme cytochrome c family protein
MNQSVMRLVFISLVLTTLALFLPDLTVTRATPPQGRSSARSRGTKVGDLFRNNCARCHGADGAGDTPLGHTYNTPDFTDPEWWRKHSNITSAGSLAAIVSHGKGGMPAFGRKLTRAEILRLVDYVRRFRKQKASSGGLRPPATKRYDLDQNHPHFRSRRQAASRYGSAA